MSTHLTSCFSLISISASLVLPVFAGTAKANPALEGYANYEALAQQVEQLAESDLVSVKSLGKTIGGRDVHLLTIGTGDVDTKPAILIVGNVHAPHVAGSELALRFAKRLVEQAGTDEPIKALLDRFTVYVIPRPSPDATEKNFAAPFREIEGNARKTDDDRDGEFGEDPPDDLNGDGWITMMRVADPTGEYMLHPDDDRILIKADSKKNEQGQFQLYIEGKDNDGDDEWNEDAGDGVSFNDNFTFEYPYFKQGAGPHQVSETETRAVADFAFEHPNIAVVFTFTPEDNLMHPWKPNAQSERGRIKSTLLTDDAPYQDYLAEKYRKTHGGKDAPSSPDGEGSFTEWAYFHYGRWSLAARGWWVPKVEEKKEGEESEKNSSDEKRGADEINALRWLEQQGIDGFVNWTPIEHPDFPGKKVEVGGFKPFYRLNPPVAELDELATKHVTFFTEVASLTPRIEIHEAKAESLGGDVYRVAATIVNNGFLPTMPEMGSVNDQMYPLQIQLNLPEATTWIQGSPRQRLGRLAGNGGKVEHTWIVRLPEDAPARAKLRVWAPAVGSHEIEIEFE